MGFASVTIPFEANWYFGSVLAGFRDELAPAGLEVSVHVVPWQPGSTAAAVAAMDDDLARDDCIGAVGMGCSPSSAQGQRLGRHGKPVVLTSVRSSVLPTVRVDDVVAARLATEHLVALGHRSIVHLTGFTAQAVAADDFSMRIDRARGFSEVMTSAGLEDFAQVKPCEFEDLEKVRSAALQVLRGAQRPTAIFCVTDEVAFVVLRAAKEAGLAVPSELSVVGIDDHPESESAGLSTVRQSPIAVGAMAARRLRGLTDEDDQTVALELVPRRSSAAPGAKAPPRPSRRFGFPRRGR